MFSNRILVRSFFFERNKFADAPNVIRDVGKVSNDSYSVPDQIHKPPYYYVLNKQASTVGKIEIKNEKQIEGMRKSCRLAARILNMCQDVVKVGLILKLCHKSANVSTNLTKYFLKSPIFH